MTRRIPIMRIGWKEAAELLEKGWKLSILWDGHAELLDPIHWISGGRGPIQQGRCAVYFLTRRSVELLFAHGKDNPNLEDAEVQINGPLLERKR